MRPFLLLPLLCLSQGRVPQPVGKTRLVEPVYVLIDTQGGETCYSRLYQGFPADRTRMGGDRLRYTPAPPSAEAMELPAPVSALFRSIPIRLPPAFVASNQCGSPARVTGTGAQA